MVVISGGGFAVELTVGTLVVTVDILILDVTGFAVVAVVLLLFVSETAFVFDETEVQL